MRHDLFVMGVPTIIISDHPCLLATAGMACAGWSGECGTEASGSGPVIELTLDLSTASTQPMSACVTVEGSRLTLEGGDLSGRADATTRCAWASVPARLIDAPERLAAEVLDTLLLFLLARAGRIPVHAAGIILGDMALVQAGSSGSGKSTLALAAARRGLPILSDDTIYVELSTRLRLWGTPHPIHVFPRDAPPGAHPIRLRGGKAKVALDPGTARVRNHVGPVALIVLEQRGILRLAPLAEAILPPLDPGFDLLAEPIGHAWERLAKSGAWHLSLSDDPDAAITLLCEHFG